MTTREAIASKNYTNFEEPKESWKMFLRNQTPLFHVCLFTKYRMGLNTCKLKVATDPILFLNMNLTKRTHIRFYPLAKCCYDIKINCMVHTWLAVAWIPIAGRIAIDRIARTPPRGSRFRCWLWGWFWFWFWLWCSFYADEKEDTNTKSWPEREHVTCVICAA